MGDTAEFLKTLPDNAAEYARILESTNTAKKGCSKGKYPDVIKLEELRQKIATEELPLLKKLWESIKFVDRLTKHGEIHQLARYKQLKPGKDIVTALSKFRHLFKEKNMFGTPKIIGLSKDQLDSLPKDKYKWNKFKKLFKEEQELLRPAKKAKPEQFQETKKSRLPLLSGKSTVILLVVVILGVSGGFTNLFAGETDSSEVEVSYWRGTAPPFYLDDSDVLYDELYLKVTKYKDGTVRIYDKERSESIMMSGNSGTDSESNRYQFVDDILKVRTYREGVVIRLTKQTDLRGSQHSSKEILETGDIYFNAKDYSRAIWEYSLVLEKDPSLKAEAEKKLAESYFLYGKQSYDNKDYKNAKERFENAVKYKDDESEYHNWLGNANRRLENYDSAISNYKKAIELNSKHDNAWNGLGVCYNKKGMITEACNAWNEGVKLNNKFSVNNLKKYCN